MRCLLLSAVIASIAVGDRAQAENEALSFQSSAYSSFRQLLTGAAPDRRVDVHAALGFPIASSGRVPAVILVHTLAGYRDQNEGWQASALREAGFATLTYDSFAARGMGDLVATPRRETLLTRQRWRMRFRRYRPSRVIPALIRSVLPSSVFRSAEKLPMRLPSSVFVENWPRTSCDLPRTSPATRPECTERAPPNMVTLALRSW